MRLKPIQGSVSIILRSDECNMIDLQACVIIGLFVFFIHMIFALVVVPLKYHESLLIYSLFLTLSLSFV